MMVASLGEELALRAAGRETVLVLRRESGRADAVLHGRGRDLPEFEHAFDFDQRTGLWRHLGEADDYRHSEERSAIVDVLRRASGPLGPTAILEALGNDERELPALKKMLARLVAQGSIKKQERGQYVAA